MNISLGNYKQEIKHPVMLVLLCTLNLAFQPLQHHTDPAPYPAGFAFVGVNVIPMDRERVLKEQTVFIQNDRIVAIGDKKTTKIPAGVHSINAHGMYLLPGFADMHVHMHNLSDALLWLVNGVTTVRNMRGTPLHLSWREKIKTGEMIGPTIYTCGPILDGLPPTGENVSVIVNQAEAEETVLKQKEAGYDCLKVYNRLSEDSYKVLVTAAREHGMPVAGHVPISVGLKGVLSAGQNSIEHLTGYMHELKSNDNTVNMEKLPGLAASTRRAEVWNCVTLVVQKKLSESNEFDVLSKSFLMKYIPPLRLQLWHPEKNARLAAMREEDFAGARRGIEVLYQITKSLHQNNAGLLLGTDAPSYFVLPGFSVHEELMNLVEAGLKPYDALITTTRNPAAFLNAITEFGTIEVGKRADLILLKGNPLENISYSRHIAGVMVRGHWIPESQIEQILKDVVESYRVQENRFRDLPELPSNSSKYRKYEITSGGIVVGEERFAIIQSPDESVQVISQQVTDPPLNASYTLHWSRSRSENVQTFSLQSRRPEGSGDVSIRIQNDTLSMQSNLPSQGDLSELRANLVGDPLFHTPFMALKILLAEKLLSKENPKQEFSAKELDFGVFFNKSFEFRNTYWKVTRSENDDWESKLGKVPVKKYFFEVDWNHQKNKGVFIVDTEGLPVEFQYQNRAFRRVE